MATNTSQTSALPGPHLLQVPEDDGSFTRCHRCEERLSEQERVLTKACHLLQFRSHRLPVRRALNLECTHKVAAQQPVWLATVKQTASIMNQTEKR
jgi:hypothetical protein